MTALEKIAARLDELAGFADEPDHSVDSFDLRHLARQVRAQIEIAEQGIAE
jgi:hypothetical protein